MVRSYISALLSGQLALDTPLQQIGKERNGGVQTLSCETQNVPKQNKALGGFPQSLDQAGEEGGGEGRAESSGQRVEVI